MRDSDLRRVFGLTWAGWINVFLQFTCFRIYRVIADDGETIEAWALRWSPVWRCGWTVPSFRRRPRARAPLRVPYGRAVYRTADGGIAAGQLVALASTLRAVRAAEYRAADIVGRVVTGAPAGGVASVAIGGAGGAGNGFAVVVGEVTRVSVGPNLRCDHGVTFDKEIADQAQLTAEQVRQRWPRLSGACPHGCGFDGIAYASTAHMVYGDW